jgi:hypothetical protein
MMLSFEPEVVEAVLGGLMIGGAIGSVFGIVSLALSQGGSRLIIVLSMIPMLSLLLWLLLFVS